MPEAYAVDNLGSHARNASESTSVGVGISVIWGNYTATTTACGIFGAIVLTPDDVNKGWIYVGSLVIILIEISSLE